MELRSRLEMANDNAAGQWMALAGVQGWETRIGPGWTAVRCEGAANDAHRVLLTRRPGDSDVLMDELLALFREWDTRRLCLEDPYGVLDLVGFDCERFLPMPVMVREPGPVEPRPTGPGPSTGGTGAGTGTGVGVGAGAGVAAGSRPAPAVEVVEALEEAELAQAEWVVVEGFPVPAQRPWRRGRTFPMAWRALAGRRTWLARLHGAPVGACVSWDDGSSVGLYWVAVLPEHRSHGLARRLVERVLDEHPELPMTLSATLLGEPLYRKLGFVEQGVATWWGYPGMGSGSSTDRSAQPSARSTPKE